MMTFVQYILSKVAEESVEFTKEVLKGQQQGLFSSHRGKRNLDFIREEFIDLYARASVLEKCSELNNVGDTPFELLPIRLDLTESNMLDVDYSIAKMCYYALMAYNSGQIKLTENELEYVILQADIHKEIMKLDKL